MSIHLEHIGFIMSALDGGLDEMVKARGKAAPTVTHESPDPASLDPERFNRMIIYIDGERYCASIFHSPEYKAPEYPLCPDCGEVHDPNIRCPNYHAGMHR